MLVTRPRPKNHKQEIDCNWLALVFGKKVPTATPDGVIQVAAEGDSEAGAATDDSLLSGIELLTIRARATSNPNSPQRQRMKLISTEHGLDCELDDLLYDAPRQMLTLTDPVQVDVTRSIKAQQQKFEAPQVEIRHNGELLEQVSGLGGGRFSHRQDAAQKRPDIRAQWKDRLDLIPHPDLQATELTVRGDATLRHQDQMQFDAAVITAWMLPLESLGGGPAGSRAAPASQGPPAGVACKTGRGFGQRCVCRPGIVGRQIQNVDIQIVSGQNVPVSRPQAKKRDGSGVEQASATDPNEMPLVFEATRLEGVAVYDPALRTWVCRSCMVTTECDSGERRGCGTPAQNVPFELMPIRVTSREFSATSSGGNRQVLALRGVVDEKGVVREPVIAKFGEFSLEGPAVVIDREKNLATITGQGVLRFPVEEDLSGNRLNPPQLADIACLEKITFDGQRATFLGSVKASVLTNVVRSEEMTAVLNQRIDFSADRPDTRGLAIETLDCQGKVRFEMYERNPQNDTIVEILKANFHDFTLNQKTGDFTGHGPGKIQDWRRAGTRRMLVQSRTAAQANRPANTNREFPWEYVGIEFEDQLTGNVQLRWGRLNERVELIYAPVKNAYEIFVRNDLDSEEAGNAVWIGSDQLTVGLSGEPGQPPMATVEAQKNAEMEGQLFCARPTHCSTSRRKRCSPCGARAGQRHAERETRH